jgi:uncharacterized peroxidase-related enzyme
MNRIAQIDPLAAPPEVRPLFKGVNAKLGIVPNLFRVLGNAPAALSGYLKFSEALADGAFNAKLREQIALTIAESNQCEYCLSAHAFIAGKLGLTEKDIADARNANGSNDRNTAILQLARTIAVQRGELTDEDFEQARRAGLTDGDIVETVANVALNIFSNYVNHAARTIIDFPSIKRGNTHVEPTCVCA